MKNSQKPSLPLSMDPRELFGASHKAEFLHQREHLRRGAKASNDNETPSCHNDLGMAPIFCCHGLLDDWNTPHVLFKTVRLVA